MPMTGRIYIVIALLFVSGTASFLHATREGEPAAIQQDIFKKDRILISPDMPEELAIYKGGDVAKGDDAVIQENHADNEVYQHHQKKQPPNKLYATYNSWNNPMLTADKITIPDEYEDKSSFIDLLISRWNGNISEEENNASAAVFFTSISPERAQSLHYNINSFSNYSGRIYSCVESNDPNFKNRRKILTKWKNSSGQVLYFDYLDIDPEKKHNYIWFDRPYWEPGIYNVEIFELENNIRLLASGSFVVSSLEQYIGHLGLYEYDSQSFPKNSFFSFSRILVKFHYSSQTADQFDFVVRNLDVNVSQDIRSFFLAPAVDGIYKQVIKYENAHWQPGVYTAELWSRGGELAGRTVFEIAE